LLVSEMRNTVYVYDWNCTLANQLNWCGCARCQNPNLLAWGRARCWKN
jgi:hypothetical protein